MISKLIEIKKKRYEIIPEYKRIYFYDSYGIYEGTAEVISDYLNRQNFIGQFIPYTFKKDFYSFGDNQSLYERYQLDVNHIVTMINRLEN